jgi:hypothetical protein
LEGGKQQEPRESFPDGRPGSRNLNRDGRFCLHHHFTSRRFLRAWLNRFTYARSATKFTLYDTEGDLFLDENEQLLFLDVYCGQKLQGAFRQSRSDTGNKAATTCRVLMVKMKLS